MKQILDKEKLTSSEIFGCKEKDIKNHMKNNVWVYEDGTNIMFGSYGQINLADLLASLELENLKYFFSCSFLVHTTKILDTKPHRNLLIFKVSGFETFHVHQFLEGQFIWGFVLVLIEPRHFYGTLCTTIGWWDRSPNINRGPWDMGKTKKLCKFIFTWYPLIRRQELKFVSQFLF